MKKVDLIKYLDLYLDLKSYKDGSQNGLQVDNNSDIVNKIGFAVDASSYIFDEATKENVDILIVHHGLFWEHEQTITGLHFERINKLFQNNIALYGCHLPLDAHIEIGNNFGLAKMFVEYTKENKAKLDRFSSYGENEIGCLITFDNKIDLKTLVGFLKQNNINPEVYNNNELKNFKTLGIVSGGGGGEIMLLGSKNIDIYLTGEPLHYQLLHAKDIGQTIVEGGHYETETIGVKLLAKHLEKKFGVETVFIDKKY